MFLGKNMKNMTVVFAFQNNETEGTYLSRQVNEHFFFFVDCIVVYLFFLAIAKAYSKSWRYNTKKE